MPRRKAVRDEAISDLDDTLKRLERITTLMEQRVAAQTKVQEVEDVPSRSRRLRFR